MKKGQITLFVVLGIIILGLVSLILFYRESVISNLQQVGLLKGVSLPVDIENLKSNIQKCVDDTFISGLVVVGLNGGIIVPSRDYLSTEGSTIVYWNNYGKFNGPNLNEIKTELEDYMSAILPSCVNLDQYKKFKFNEVTPKATVNLGKDKSNVVVDYKLTINSANSSYNLFKPYASEAPVKFGRIYDAAKSIADFELKNPGKIDVTYLLSTGLNVNVLTIDNETIVYVITDYNSKISGISYTFNIASRSKK